MTTNNQTRFSNWLMGIITFCVTGILGFIWNLNTIVSTLQERDREKSAKMDQVQLSLDQVRMLQQESREKLIGIDFRVQNIESYLPPKK